MSENNQKYEAGKATICIVNYKTEQLTKLCLRSIRKFTEFPYQVIVVDNDSGDSSLEYLRSLEWIKLIERPGEMVKSGSWAHGTALDIGLEACETEFYLAMHSDTFVHKQGWLKELIDLGKSPVESVCCGAGKLDLKPRWQVILKKCTDIKDWIRKLKNTKRIDFYIRTICALYKTEILKKEDLGFAMRVDEGITCGQQLYYELIDRGYTTHPLSPYKMADYIYHLAHATMVLNPEFTVRKRTEKKCQEKMAQIINSSQVQDILNDSSLDK